MAEESSSVRVTNVQVYNKLMEINAVQIEMVTELRGMKTLPEKVAELDARLGKVELISKLAYTVFGAAITSIIIASLGGLNV